MHLHDWLQRLSLVGTMALLGACNGSGGGNTEDTNTIPTTMTATGTTGTTGATTGTTTGTTGPTGTTTGEPTTGGSGGQTDTASATTSPGTTTVETTTGSTGSTAGTSGTEGSSGASTDTDETGGMMGMPCESAKDCQLADSCCYCEVLGPGEPAPPCDDIQCLISTCAGYELEKAELECRWGVCTFAKLTCNPLGITCKSLPPQCAAGDVPGVLEDDNGKCWTGLCVPAEACDWVPDCSYCAAPDLVCVLKGQKGAYHVCEPRPLDCEPGDIDCDCGQQICDASEPHTVCHDEADGIQCECPFC